MRKRQAELKRKLEREKKRAAKEVVCLSTIYSSYQVKLTE